MQPKTLICTLEQWYKVYCDDLSKEEEAMSEHDKLLVYVLGMYHDGFVYVKNRPDRGETCTWTDDKSKATLYRTMAFAQEVCDKIKERSDGTLKPEPRSAQCQEGASLATKRTPFLFIDSMSDVYGKMFRSNVFGEFKPEWPMPPTAHMRRKHRRRKEDRDRYAEGGIVIEPKAGPIMGTTANYACVDEMSKLTDESILDFQLASEKRVARKHELKKRSMETHKHHHKRILQIVTKQDDIIATQRHAIFDAEEELAKVTTEKDDLEQKLKASLGNEHTLAADKQKLQIINAGLRRTNERVGSRNTVLAERLERINEVAKDH